MSCEIQIGGIVIRFVDKYGFEKWIAVYDLEQRVTPFGDRKFARRMYRHDDGHIETFYQELPVKKDPELHRYGPHDAETFKQNAMRLWDDIVRMREGKESK